ncbi:MAG: eL32 family ribosomal protein [Nanoarchaeota archaeon]
MSKKFTRSETVRFMRLGKNRPKLQKWRRPRGRHNKMRKKRVGYPASPSIGHGTQRATSGLVQGKKPLVVHNMKELEQASASRLIIFARTLGAKQRIEFMKQAQERGLQVFSRGRKAK